MGVDVNVGVFVIVGVIVGVDDNVGVIVYVGVLVGVIVGVGYGIIALHAWKENEIPQTIRIVGIHPFFFQNGCFR